MSPPTLPAEAKGTSAKSAKAFVRYYIDLVNFATATGQTQSLREVSDPACSSCSSMLDKIESVYSAGGHFLGKGWGVKSVKYQPFQPARRPVLSVVIHLSAQTMVEREGAKPQHFDAGPNELTLRLVSRGSGWQLSRLDRLS